MRVKIDGTDLGRMIIFTAALLPLIFVVLLIADYLTLPLKLSKSISVSNPSPS